MYSKAIKGKITIKAKRCSIKSLNKYLKSKGDNSF